MCKQEVHKKPKIVEPPTETVEMPTDPELLEFLSTVVRAAIEEHTVNGVSKKSLKLKALELGRTLERLELKQCVLVAEKIISHAGDETMTATQEQEREVKEEHTGRRLLRRAVEVRAFFCLGPPWPPNQEMFCRMKKKRKRKRKRSMSRLERRIPKMW